MKKFATLTGGFFCETCNKSTGSKFCIDCGKKCIEAFPNAVASPTSAKRIFCTECGIAAPTVTTRFCTGCGSSLQAATASSSAIEEEKRKKAQEEEQKRLQEEKQREAAAREAREAAARQAEAEAKRKQEEEARAKALAERAKLEEEKKRQEEVKRKEAQASQSQRRPLTGQGRFCIECGAKSALPTAKFCVQCGKTFEDLPAAAPAAALPPVPTVTPPALPASRSPPSTTSTLKKKPPMPTLRAPLRPPCRKCGAPTGPRFCTACGETTEEEDRLRASGTNRAPEPQARTSESQATGKSNDEAEATRALRAMLEERERELKRMQELLQSHQNSAAQQIMVEEPSAPAAPPPAPDFDVSFLAPATAKTLAPRGSLHDQLKTATLKKTVVGPRPKSVSTSSRLRGATFLGAMERIQAATSKDLEDDDGDDWDGDD